MSQCISSAEFCITISPHQAVILNAGNSSTSSRSGIGDGGGSVRSGNSGGGFRLIKHHGGLSVGKSDIGISHLSGSDDCIGGQYGCIM